MGTTLQGIKLYLSIQIFFLIFFFFSYKMKICYFFVIVAGVIALGAVTAAREIKIVKRDTAASEDESKLLAEDPNGEAGKASLLAQLTRREADEISRLQQALQRAVQPSTYRRQLIDHLPPTTYRRP